jgi:hypothetical protein
LSAHVPVNHLTAVMLCAQGTGEVGDTSKVRYIGQGVDIFATQLINSVQA